MESLKVVCNCKSKYQDTIHGLGIRVSTPKNKTRHQGKLTQQTCTVCGTIHNIKEHK